MKSLSRLIIAGAAVIAAGLILTACNSTTTTTEYGTDGKITKVTAVAKESPLAHKTFSTGGGITAIDVETSVSSSSESTTPHVILGGSAFAISSSSADPENNKPTMCYAFSCGWLKSLTSMSATSGAITYTGVKGETAVETAARLNALVKAKNDVLSSDTTVDSGITSTVSK